MHDAVALGDTVLVGPPPAQLLDAVPHDDLIRGAMVGIPELLGDLESDTRNVLLTLARIWTTLQTGQIRSKDAAAVWVLEQLPPEHQPVLARARAMYLGGEDEERWDDLTAVRATLSTSSMPSGGTPACGPVTEAFPRKRDSHVYVRGRDEGRTHSRPRTGPP